MENTLTEILNKLTKMEERDTRVEQKLDGIQGEIKQIQKVNSFLKSENEELKREVKQQERRLEELEKEIRRKNITIYGLNEDKEGNSASMKIKIKEVLTKVEVDIDNSIYIEEIRRNGYQKENNIRPVLVQMKDWKKIDILKASKKLQGTNIFINEDYSKSV